MNPYKLREIYKYLTRAKKADPELPNVFPASKAPIPPVKQDVETMDAINAFIKRERQQKAGGGRIELRKAGAVRKPLTAREQKIYDNYEKARKDVKLPSVTDDQKVKYKSAVRAGKINNSTIKKLKEKYRYEKPVKTQRLRYDTKLKRWEKQIGRELKTYVQKPNETKSQFIKRVENIGTESKVKAREKQDVANTKVRNYIDKWTTNWFDNNLNKYGVRDFDKMTSNLKKDWQKQIKNLDIDKGFMQSLSTKSGLPNVTTTGANKFNYNNIPFYTSAEVTKTPLSQWRNLFLKNKIDTAPGFKQKILDYFNFINQDKRGLYRQADGQTIKAYKDIMDKDVVYLLSPDANLLSSAKYNLFNSVDGEFSNAYNSYSNKINTSKQWKESAAKIEKTLGLKSNFIKNSMDKEKKALAKIFDVKQLPEELRYTLEHGQGLSAAAKTGNKEIMQTAVNDLIGTTVKQNKALGFGGFEANRNALVRDITAGVNVEDNLKSLNQLSKNVYKDFGLKGNMYSIKDGQLTSKPISTALTQEDRFGQYFKEIAKTKEGAAEIKKQAGSLKNLENKLLQNIVSYSKLSECKIGKAEGGRIGFANSITCIQDGLKEQKIAAQQGNKKAARELVQVGKVATRAGLLKNLLGPGAFLGEAVYEGAVIGNKVLGGKPSDIAYAESYLSYLDPRKYRGELDPLKMEREDMVTRTINDETIDGLNANLLRSGFAAQDQVSAFNEAVNEKLRGETAGRLDIANKAAADIREQSKFVNPAKDIISSEAFKDATNIAQEYLQGQAGKQMADFGVFSVPQSTIADEGRRVRAMTEMRELNPLMSDQELLELLKSYNINPKDYDYTYTPRNFPADTSSKPLTGFDNLRDFYQQQQATQNIADAGGVANLAGGGIAKIAGDSSGRPPVSGPNPQGLLSLKNRVRNY